MKFNPNKYEVNFNSKIIDVLKFLKKIELTFAPLPIKNEFIGIITLSISKSFSKGATSEQKIINFINKKPLIIKSKVNENKVFLISYLLQNSLLTHH